MMIQLLYFHNIYISKYKLQLTKREVTNYSKKGSIGTPCTPPMLSYSGFSYIPLQTSLTLLIFLILACRFTAHSLSKFVYFFLNKIIIYLYVQKVICSDVIRSVFLYAQTFYVQYLYVKIYTFRRYTFGIYTFGRYTFGRYT